MKVRSNLQANTPMSPVNFAVVAHVRGEFSFDAFSAALAKARQRHPLIAGRVYSDEEGNWYGTDGVGQFSIRVTEGAWTAAIEEELNVPFVAGVGPLVRFVLVQNGDLIDIVMICHHAIADGMAAAYVLRDILNYIAHPEAAVEPLPVCPTIDELLPPFDPATLGELQPPQNTKNRVWGDSCLDPMRFYVLSHRLTELQTTLLSLRARQEQTTVHGALCTAFLKALMQLEPGDPDPIRKVSSPVNLRDRLATPVGEQFGGYINPGIHTVLDCDSVRSFWDLAREVKESLRREMAGDNVFRSLRIFRARFQMARTDKTFNFMRPGHPSDYDLSITNLGRLDFPVQYGSLCLEAISGPSVNPQGREKVLGVSTAAEQLTWTFTAPYRLMARAMGQRLLTTAEDILSEAVGW